MMWELIRLNKKKSVLLFACMALILLTLGYLIGEVFFERFWVGILLAIVVWAILAAVSFTKGESILLKTNNTYLVSKEMHPQLHNVVEEMCLAANINYKPQIYLIATPSLNAFATGIKEENAAIAVTTGLLEKLNRDELQGVIAHELSHIYHRDTLYMTLAATMLGSIQMLSRMSLRASRFVGGSRFSSGSGSRSRSKSSSNSSSNSSGLRALLFLLLILVSIIGPFFAMLFYFSLSRKREYLADASAARLTRYPEGLASALEKISMSSFIRNANSLTGPMFIVNPLRSTDSLLNYSTHPRTEDRIAILRGMNKGAGLVSYQDAYARVTNKSGPLIPPIAMTLASRQETELAIREKSSDVEVNSQSKMMDYIRAQNSFIFIECSCGLKMKIPPNFKENKITCPKCKMENYVVNFDSIDSPSDVDPEGKQVYIRKNTGWETIQCKKCNHLINMSPLFNSPAITCQMCKSQIVVKKQGEYMVDPAL